MEFSFDLFSQLNMKQDHSPESEGGKENCKHCGDVKSLSKRVGGPLIQGNGE